MTPVLSHNTLSQPTQDNSEHVALYFKTENYVTKCRCWWFCHDENLYRGECISNWVNLGIWGQMSDLTLFKKPELVIINCLVTLHFLSCPELSFNKVCRIEVINILTQMSSTIHFVIPDVSGAICSLIIKKYILVII